MPAYTIVTTTAAQDAEAAEINTLSDDFVSEDEALGYSRRMADELLGLAGQLNLDFDYTNVGLYDGDLIDEDLDPNHPALIGVWILDDEGAAYLTAEEFRTEATDAAPE